MSYRIKTVEKLTGLSRNTITAWERRHELLEPVKDGSGYRIYSDEDVQTLLRVRSLLDEGFQISEIVLRIRKESTPLAANTAESVLISWRAELLQYLLSYNRSGADTIAARLLEIPYRQRIDEVFLPLLRDIGDGWREGRVSVAQEHFSSAYVRELLLSIYRTIEDGYRLGPVAICASYQGDPHELGLLAVSIHLSLFGYRVVYLGADLPLDEIPRVVEQKQVQFVCLSVFAADDPHEIEQNAERLLGDLPPGVCVVFGGPAVRTLAERSRNRLWFCPTLDDLLSRLQPAPRQEAASG